jgi:hypothetical protein
VKIVEYCDILNERRFDSSPALKRAWRDVKAAVTATDWPHGSRKFSIYPESGKKRGKGNGVLPIKIPCVAKLKQLGWQDECLPHIPGGVLDCGDLDAMKLTKEGSIAFEWETGNISSSHRAINKLLLTLQVGGLLGGFLVVPSNRLKVYLTDRIGNIGELKPYFPLWKSVVGAVGGLRIVVVEHDREDLKSPRIPKATDGRAAN